METIVKQALQRLSPIDENALIEVTCANGFTRGDLKCLMTRQRGEGTGIYKRGFWAGESHKISYDLMLCEYCGNLMPSKVCPAKAQMVKERMLND